MATARVTSKGQVTIPAEVRRALKIAQGDDLVFQVTSERSAELRVQKRKRLSDFYGALPAVRPYPGKEAIREEVGRDFRPRDAGDSRDSVIPASRVGELFGISE